MPDTAWRFWVWSDRSERFEVLAEALTERAALDAGLALKPRGETFCLPLPLDPNALQLIEGGGQRYSRKDGSVEREAAAVVRGRGHGSRSGR